MTSAELCLDSGIAGHNARIKSQKRVGCDDVPETRCRRDLLAITALHTAQRRIRQTKKKKKKPSWHPCLESSSVESTLGCSVHRQSPKGPFSGGEMCAQSYFFFFFFF